MLALAPEEVVEGDPLEILYNTLGEVEQDLMNGNPEEALGKVTTLLNTCFAFVDVVNESKVKALATLDKIDLTDLEGMFDDKSYRALYIVKPFVNFNHLCIEVRCIG